MNNFVVVNTDNAIAVINLVKPGDANLSEIVEEISNAKSYKRFDDAEFALRKEVTFVKLWRFGLGQPWSIIECNKIYHRQI